MIKKTLEVKHEVAGIHGGNSMKEGTFTEQQVLRLAKKAYQEGNASFEVVPRKSALLVIDMQDEFVKPHWTPYWVPEATRQVPRIKKLIEHCRTHEAVEWGCGH